MLRILQMFKMFSACKSFGPTATDVVQQCVRTAPFIFESRHPFANIVRTEPSSNFTATNLSNADMLRAVPYNARAWLATGILTTVRKQAFLLHREQRHNIPSMNNAANTRSFTGITLASATTSREARDTRETLLDHPSNRRSVFCFTASCDVFS